MTGVLGARVMSRMPMRKEGSFPLARGRSSQAIHADDAVLCAQNVRTITTRTRRRRARSASTRSGKKRAFQEIYDRFSNTISVSYSSGLWDSLDLTSEFEKNDADFFEIYAEYAIK